ncbi:hypothetical protein JW859_07075 [bacterium]|nr:hypothetical protein [bacterium]
MRKILFVAIVCLVALIAGCSGGNPFVPPLGPYTGVFMDGATQVGEFTFTTGDGLLAGTGYITHGGNQIIVSISAVLDEQAIDGQITNEQLGYGSITGQFSSSERCNGAFIFTDTLQTSETTGTWNAVLD